MLYLTAGLWDLYANTNIDTETAIVKVIQCDFIKNDHHTQHETNIIYYLSFVIICN